MFSKHLVWKKLKSDSISRITVKFTAIAASEIPFYGVKFVLWTSEIFANAKVIT